VPVLKHLAPGCPSFLSIEPRWEWEYWGTYINSAKIYDIIVNSNNEICTWGSDYGYSSGDNLTTLGAHQSY
jgi:hypothetical protein